MSYNGTGDELVVLAGDEEEYDEPLATGQQKFAIAPAVDSLNNADAADDSDGLIGVLGSTEYIDAVDAIANDPWDVGSWIVYLEEVECGRAVSGTTISEAYEKILAQFPRSAVIWKRYIEFILRDPSVDKERIEALFNSCLVPCRNVELWKFYLKFVEQNTVGTTSPNTSAFMVESKKFQTVLERAIEHVGYHLEAASIWQDYIKSVRTCVDMDVTLDSLRRVTIVRKTFQRAVCIPLLKMDDIWNEYETFENVNAATGGDLELTEYNKRHLHARSVLKERKSLANNVEFDKLACPPPHSIGDVNQLDAWNSWIIFERGNPDNLGTQQLYEMVRLVYDQCLCCFLYNAEVWLSLAKFVETHKGHAEARAIYIDAINYNSSVALLRIALAEHDERTGDIENAEKVLQECFEKIPSGFTFSVLQQFLRRQKGIEAARKVFSDTLELRQNNPKLALELYVRHAFVEETMNLNLKVALRILNLARERCPTCLSDLSYIRAISRVLVGLGDGKQIRWLFQVALSKIGTFEQVINVGGDTAVSVIESGKVKTSVSADGSNDELKLELALVEEFLNAELSLGTTELSELSALRARRDALKISFDEQERNKLGSKAVRVDIKKLSLGFYGGASEFVERYGDCFGHTLPLPQLDADLKDRTSRKFSLNFNTQGYSAAGTGGSAAIKRNDTEFFNSGAEFQLSLTGLPVIVRELLSRLPLHSGPAPDVELFMRHIKGITLPPRPSAEESEADAKQRQHEGNSVSWTDSNYESADVDLEIDDVGDSDVFRKRQRAKLDLE